MAKRKQRKERKQSGIGSTAHGPEANGHSRFIQHHHHHLNHHHPDHHHNHHHDHHNQGIGSKKSSPEANGLGATGGF